MRELSVGPKYRLRAIGGLHVVTLAWDTLDGTIPSDPLLLGFAIERAELDDGAEVVERYWMRGIKRFRHKDEGTAPGSPVPTSEHPIQAFQWGDYTAKPDTTYRYRLVPAIGKPKLLSLDFDNATEVTIRTEAEIGEMTPGEVRHDIFFNRGAAGSQAYARRFGKTRPDPDDPHSEQMRWLSRGLFEALTGFIGVAAGADAADYALRGMLYEFRYAPVGEALRVAAAQGADVAIHYEAQTYREENEAMISAVGIENVCKAQKVREGIRHNKFLVLLRHGSPIAVWTGSTNISAGGIFGHSNVGHVVWDQVIAQVFLDYWDELSVPTVTTGKLRKFAVETEPTPAAGTLPPRDRVLTLFSPRDPYDPDSSSPTLSWYADLLGEAQKIACMTFAFNFDPVFQNVVSGAHDSLTYLVFDKALQELEDSEIRANGNTIIAAGAKLDSGDLENFLGEVLTGFNRNRYIHDKFLLVDPLGEDPIVVTGTANFSEPSQEKNDENMLVIRGDRRVADIYFGEFMRIFDHLYARYIVDLIRKRGASDPSAGFLKEERGEWLPAQFGTGYKSKRRKAFLAGD